MQKTKKAYFRRKLQSAYEQPTYESAKKALISVKRELALVNASAVKSLEEGFEETLTLHRLGLFPHLGESFKTTNCIENINKLLSGYTGRVNRWQNSQQRQRWVATALLEIEPNLRKIRGFEYLKDLRVVMRNIATQVDRKEATAA